MSTLEQINSNKPIEFTGHRTTISDDPVLVEMAEKTKTPNLRLVTTPITEVFHVPAEESKVLLDFLRSNPWRRAFDENLQCISETHKGELLLTGWLSFTEFQRFLSETQDPSCAIHKISQDMKAWLDAAPAGLEEIFFDAFRL